MLAPIDRFLAKVEWSDHRHDGTRCLEWIACLSGGYGMFWFDGRMVQAHRWLYERWFGPIPDGLEPDHLCRVRPCVNPDHLELVTHRANVLRGGGHAAVNAVKTHCPAGHPYDDENTYVDGRGSRNCRTCHRAADARYSLRRRQK